MNDTQSLTNCRGCNSEFFNYAWLSPPLPIHLWPVPSNTQTCDQKAAVFVCKSCGLAQLNEMPNLHWSHSKPQHYIVFHKH